MVFMVYRRQYHLLARTRQALDLDAIALPANRHKMCYTMDSVSGRVRVLPLSSIYNP